MAQTRPARRRARWTPASRAAVAFAGLAAGTWLLRRRALRWGATTDEQTEPLAGDELLPAADLTATRALTIHAAPDRVWPWLVQLGQGRGGFYSYDFLENLVGCDIHSAREIVPAWQSVAVGSEVRLHPTVALTVARVDPVQALVLRGGVPMGDADPPYDFTWAFVLRPGPHGTTRLLVRERYQYSTRWAAAVVEPVQLVSLFMTTRMLHGIRERAEQVVHGGAP